MIRLLWLPLALFVLPASARAQAPIVGNPIAVEFEFLDWEQATGYEVDIVEQATRVVTNTLRYGPSRALAGTITVHLEVNVQPTAHGVYVFIARGVLPGGVTENSAPSDPWERIPGPPGKPVAIGAK